DPHQRPGCVTGADHLRRQRMRLRRRRRDRALLPLPDRGDHEHALRPGGAPRDLLSRERAPALRRAPRARGRAADPRGERGARGRRAAGSRLLRSGGRAGPAGGGGGRPRPKDRRPGASRRPGDEADPGGDRGGHARRGAGQGRRRSVHALERPAGGAEGPAGGRRAALRGQMTDDGSAPVLEDASLPLFEPPASGPGPRIGAAAPELVIVAPAAPRPFLLEGTSAAVRGTESGAVCEFRFPAVPLVPTVAREVGGVASVMLSPGRMRRERVGRGSSVIETVLVAPDLPLAVIDWSSGAGTEGGHGETPIEILIREADAPGPPRPVRWRAGPHAVTFALGPAAVEASERTGTPERRVGAHEGAGVPERADAPEGAGREPSAANLVVVALAGAAAALPWTVEGAPGGGVRC